PVPPRDAGRQRQAHRQRLRRLSRVAGGAERLMGQEATCTLEHEGKSSEGRAFLGTDELIFRGTFRVAVKFAEIEDVFADDGVLTVSWARKKASFDLGRAAAKWA